MKKQHLILYTLFLCAFLAHALFSVGSRHMKAAWANVPPVPSEQGAAALALGDEQLAYRMIGIMLQNMGDNGGRSTSLTKYNYDRLGDWLFLEDKLDSESNFIPYLAAFYFGATPDATQLDPLINYLALVGQRPYDQKWRWLGQAVYLARFPQKNYEKAAGLAAILAGMWHPGMPGWVRQMPAFVALQMGDKQASYDIIMSILKEEADQMHPNEVNFMVSYICERLLDESEAAQNPLCNPEK